jgi:glycosyltransferase involved in cell wall biosynthesis
VNAEPLISIVTVCLNAEKYLERCITSVISQTYKNVEYIIVDGGSTDGTLEIIEKYGSKITRWISENDRGIYDAMNKGIEMCRGDYIGLLNSDDYYAENALQIIADAICNNDDVDVMYGNTMILRDNGNFLKKYNHANLFDDMVINHSTCFIKSAIYNLHKYDFTLKIAADYGLLLRLMHDGKRFMYIDQTITYYSPYGVSSTPLFCTVIERFKIRSQYSLMFASAKFYKDFISYCDLYYYCKSSKYKEMLKSYKYLHTILCSIKNCIKPLFLKLKKRIY